MQFSISDGQRLQFGLPYNAVSEFGGIRLLMGYNARNDEIHENLERMRRERGAD